jgi:hypothetical protein
LLRKLPPKTLLKLASVAGFIEQAMRRRTRHLPAILSPTIPSACSRLLVKSVNSCRNADAAIRRSKSPLICPRLRKDQRSWPDRLQISSSRPRRAAPERNSSSIS